MRCETPFLPLKTQDPYALTEEDEKVDRKSPKAYILTKKLTREPKILPPGLQQVLQRPLPSKLGRCHSPQAAARIPIILPVDPQQIQGNGPQTFRKAKRQLSPEGIHSRPVLGVQIKKPNAAEQCDNSTDTNNDSKAVDIRSRSPREFKITTKRALDLPRRSNSPEEKRTSVDDLMDAASNNDCEKIIKILESSYFHNNEF